MLYLSSVTIIVILLLVVKILGRRIAGMLPLSVRDTAGFFIEPLLGMAGMVLLSTLYGWMSKFSTEISAPLVLAVILLGMAFEKNRSEVLREWLIVSGFALVVTLPVLAPAIRYNAFNPFNDTFTYLVHGQWLQEHAFSETAHSSGYYPAETQVVLYQRAGHRMGASFFLGFVQSIFHLQWSYYAYLATVGLVFTTGCLAIGGVIRQVIPVSRNVALVLCAMPSFLSNGFVYGAQGGFFPQTFGLAFASGLACLIPGLIKETLETKQNWKIQFFSLLPLSLMCAVLLISYSDMFPVLGAGIALFLMVVVIMNRTEVVRCVNAVLVFMIQVLVIVNVEGARILRNFIGTLLSTAAGTVHFGWPVPWSPVQFLAYTFGMKSPFNDGVIVGDYTISTWIFPFVFIALVWVLAWIWRKRPLNLAVLLPVCINAVFFVAFLKFRYASTGLAGETGNEFLQFKLAKWLAPFNLGLLAISLAWLYTYVDRYKKHAVYIFTSLFIIGMSFQFFVVTRMFTLHFRDETMRKYSPFDLFLELRSRVSNIPKDQVIYLGIPHEHHKMTQMVAYILSDRKLAGNYEDVYLRNSLPEQEKNMPIECADWIIRLKRTYSDDEPPLNRVGPFYIQKAPFSFYNLDAITGAYDTEIGDSKTWNWVNESVAYNYHCYGKVEKAQISFHYLDSGKPRILFLEVNSISGKRLLYQGILLKGGWGEFRSPVINTFSEDITVQLRADGESVQLSDSDRRMTRFLVQNIGFEPKP